jgi:hypothetical protein
MTQNAPQIFNCEIWVQCYFIVQTADVSELHL